MPTPTLKLCLGLGFTNVFPSVSPRRPGNRRTIGKNRSHGEKGFSHSAGNDALRKYLRTPSHPAKASGLRPEWENPFPPASVRSTAFRRDCKSIFVLSDGLADATLERLGLRSRWSVGTSPPIRPKATFFHDGNRIDALRGFPELCLPGRTIRHWRRTRA